MEYNISGGGSCGNSHIINLNRSCTTYSKSNIIRTYSKSNIMNINSVIGFGKYKGYTIKTLLKCIEGIRYLKWATEHDIFKLNKYAKDKLNSQSSYKMGYNEKDFLKVYTKNDTLDFGKHKGETIDSLLLRPEGPDYLIWLWKNNIICFDTKCTEIIISHIGFNTYPYSRGEYLGWDDEGLACGMLECDCY